MSQTFNNLIKFPLPLEIASYWKDSLRYKPNGQGVSPDRRLTTTGDASASRASQRITDNYLNLRVSRSDYTLITEGKGIKTKQGYRAVYGDREQKRIGFRLRVRSQAEDLYLLLVELANYTAGECGSLQPIEVLDYCHRHDRKDRERGYRIRTGVFEGEFSQVQGTVTQGFVDCSGNENVTGDRYGGGFSFKFMETEVLAGYF